MIKLSYIKSDQREYNIKRCLSLIKSEITAGLKDAKKVVVKVNCPSAKAKDAATNKEALEAVLKYIKPFVDSQIIVAEGCQIGDTLEAFKNLRYLPLQEKYDFSIIDLNNDDFEEIKLLDRNGQERPVQVAKTVLYADYLISLAMPSTHENLVYSGVVENVATGSLIRPGNGGISDSIATKFGLRKNNKNAINQGYKAFNENITRINSIMPIKLAILDGFQVLEGEGPIYGQLLPMRWVIASSNPVAADCLACTMLGINYKDVGHLALLEKGEEEYFVVGDDWQRNIKKIKMHSNFEKAKNWQ